MSQKGRNQMDCLYKLWFRYGPQSSRGQTMAEYGLIVALVAVVAIGAWAVSGTKISSFINAVAGDGQRRCGNYCAAPSQRSIAERRLSDSTAALSQYHLRRGDPKRTSH